MSTPKPKRDTLRIVAYSTLILCCVGFLGGMYFLQYRAANLPVANFTHPPDPQLVAETEQRKKEKILELRDKWQVWAKAHQPELKAMLNARPGDTAAFDNVVNAIPGIPTTKTAGLSFADMSGMANYADPVVMLVTYPPMLTKGKFADSQSKEAIDSLNQSRDMEQKRERATFDQYKDVIVMTVTSTWSKKNYCLWASGRASQCEEGIPELNKTYTDVAPSYDFLSS